jgi:acetoin utilization deacetylase AcuC-like enzyme
MSCPSGGYSPSGQKPAAVYADWLEQHLIEPMSFEPVSHDDLCLAHSTAYVEGVFSGETNNGHGNKNLDVAESTRWTVGSMVAAAREAVRSRVACSPSSGFHHACFGTCGGFCTFNGLIVASRKLLAEGLVRRVGILDCDWHYGDGTDDIMRRLKLDNEIMHHTSGDQSLRDSDHYFIWLESAIQQLREANVNLILYQAGADAHIDDPLGGLLNNEELSKRDSMVFERCNDEKIPIAWNLAGGYQRAADGSIRKVIEIHRETMRQCKRVFGKEF